MIQANNISILQPDYIEKRNEHYLLIWRDLPHWMVIDKEAYQLITLATGNYSLREIVRHLEIIENIFENKYKEVKSFIESLQNIGLIQTYSKTKIESIQIRKPVLENITINITRRCNLRCKHCYITIYESNDILNIRDIKKFVIEAYDERFLSPDLNFAILGGEPLLEKEKTIEIANFGSDMGFDVIISTNGLLIDSNFAKRAKESNLTVQVSLEGSSSEINDAIRGKGSFNEAKDGINQLVKNNVYTIISMVVQTNNFNDIESFYQFGRAMRVNEVRFIPLKIMGQAKYNIKPIPKLTLLHAIHDLIKKYKNAKMLLKRDFYSIMKTTCAHSYKTLYCGTGLKTILIDADGEVYPCPNHSLSEFRCGNIHNKSFKDIWINSPILKKIRSIYDINTINTECSKCIVKHWCAGGCRGESYENTKIMTSKAIGCKDIRDSIIETFWLLSNEDYSKYPKSREYF